MQQQAVEEFTAVKQQTLSDKGQDQLTQLIEEANNLTSTANKQLGEIEQLLKAEIKTQQQQYDVWNYLKSLIGSSDGKKSRVFAQGLTLEHLIHLVDMQLVHLHSRYQLGRKKC
jgi:exonuclease SbcC